MIWKVSFNYKHKKSWLNDLYVIEKKINMKKTCKNTIIKIKKINNIFSFNIHEHIEKKISILGLYIIIHKVIVNIIIKML
jgi:hypothetical protein